MSTITGVLPALHNLNITLDGAFAVLFLVVVAFNLVQLLGWLLKKQSPSPAPTHDPDGKTLYQNAIHMHHGKPIEIIGPVNLANVMTQHTSSGTRFLNYQHNGQSIVIPLSEISMIKCHQLLEEDNEQTPNREGE